MASKSLQLASILTDRQRKYLVLRHHEGLYVSAIAENFGVSRQTVNQTLLRAYKNLRDNNITPPVDKQDVGPIKKDAGPIRRVVNLGYMDEIVEG